MSKKFWWQIGKLVGRAVAAQCWILVVSTKAHQAAEGGSLFSHRVWVDCEARERGESSLKAFPGMDSGPSGLELKRGASFMLDAESKRRGRRTAF